MSMPSLRVRQPGNGAPRGDVREHPLAVELDRIREADLRERLERAGKRRPPESAAHGELGRLDERDRIEGVAERLRQRRLDLAVGLVEEDRERPARPQHARDLAHGVVVAEPVERLADEDRVDGVVLERNLRRRSGERLRLRHDLLEHGAHPCEGLDGDHALEAAHKLARELARAGREVEHDGVGLHRHRTERRLRIAGPPSFVRVCRALERAGELAHTPARRKARLSRSISRAITSRCTSCVPS